ncbi:MAG: hypothetical protein H6Q73_923 [Firmicutes bacterium]|nr:hypothetical protein [Bacillota bacterium]
MSLISKQQTTKAGLTTTLASAVSGGDYFVNTGKSVLRVKNASSAAVTVTVAAQTACPLGTLHNIAVSVAAAGDVLIGPFPPAYYNDANGYAYITYSAVTSVTVAVVEIP